MNYLILTPDGVGSTILQRLLTMALYLENYTVQNTHELTNGIELDNGIAVKNFDLRYSQSLGKIANILHDSQAQTTLVSRLAKYHMDNRKDPANDCQDFYKLLNRHFEKIIMCVRENIFEYAMSWSIRDQSGVLNVYNKEDRDKVSQVSEVDENYFILKCQQYVKYIEWVEHNFPNVERVSYENIVKDSDAVMQKLIGHRGTFTDKIGLPLSTILSNEYDFLKNRTESNLSNNESKALVGYRILSNKMIDNNIIFNIPFKNTTLSEKKNQIKNFDACLDKFYTFAKNHNWIDQSKTTYDFWNEEHIC
jgi:hypothetical protein|tara:strand:+ start:122 stop:1042 length:921 start_codon:yes stop_codon:yes gene_type:complete